MLGWIVTAVLIGIVIGIGMPSVILGLAHILERRILNEERNRIRNLLSLNRQQRMTRKSHCLIRGGVE